MMSRIIKVELTLKSNKEIAEEVAYEVLRRANPHESELVERKLSENDITLENLTKYFQDLQYLVADFWWSVDDISHKPLFKPHELRGLYLPLLYSVIFASVGNMKVGNYSYVLRPDEGTIPESICKEWIINFSAKLESLRMYIQGDIAQIGNRNAQPQTSVMLALMADVCTSSKTAQFSVRDGFTPDEALAGLSVLLGLTLVNSAYDILYTGVQEVNFRELVGTIKERINQES